MPFLKIREFYKWAQKKKVSDELLITSIEELQQGLHDGDLGQSIFKKRIPLHGKGKSGGARTIVAYFDQNFIVFLYGFPKNEKGNITKKEKEAFQAFAKAIKNLTAAEIETAINNNDFIVIERNQNNERNN